MQRERVAKLLVLSGDSNNTLLVPPLMAAQKKGRNMIKKVLVSVVVAGALTVPLAGVAWADPTVDPGSNGVGAGGILGGLGLSGAEVSDVAKMPGSVPDVIAGILGDPFGPGSVLKLRTPGCGHGNGPTPSFPCQ